MPDQVVRYPYIHPGDFAKGAIVSETNPNLCVDTMNRPSGNPLGLFSCHNNKTHPPRSQDFYLTWHRSIMVPNIYNECIDTFEVSLWGCHYMFGHQFWYYNLVRFFKTLHLMIITRISISQTSHQLLNPPDNCLTAKPLTKSLVMEKCLDGDENQKWLWGYTNTTALMNWKTFGATMPEDMEEYFEKPDHYKP